VYVHILSRLGHVKTIKRNKTIPNVPACLKNVPEETKRAADITRAHADVWPDLNVSEFGNERLRLIFPRSCLRDQSTVGVRSPPNFGACNIRRHPFRSHEILPRTRVILRLSG